MYLDHFGLSQPPFKITPNTEFFYTGGNRGAILDALLYTITHGEGIIKVTGEIGSGKTMLCRRLVSLLPENVEAIYLVNPSLNRDEVLYTIADELGLNLAGQRTSLVIRELQHHLIEKHAQGHQVVAFIYEAQAMPLDSLEEIRLLSNLETSHQKLLQIMLFGQPELDENLGLPRMRQLKERITHSFTVPPLAQTDIPEYLMFRMRAAGYHGPDIFSAGAIGLIAAAAQGVTRRINVLADKALLAAFSENTHNILPKHVKAAIKDSEFSAPSSALPLKKIGLAILLLGFGIALGASWQYFAGAPHKAAAQATLAPAAQTAIQEQPAQTPAKSTPAPAVDTAPASRQGSPGNPPAPTSTPSPASNPLQQRLDATLSWLASEDGTHYTVQLMLLTDTGAMLQLERALRKLDREFGATQIYAYPTRITAEHQYNITIGNFPSREQALAARAKLPAHYQANRPVLRTVKGIRDEMARQRN